MSEPLTPGSAQASEGERLTRENTELRARMQELQDTLDSINNGDVDALIVNGDIYTLDRVNATTNRMRQDVLSQMTDAVFAFDTDEHIVYVNAAAERRYGIQAADVLGRHRSDVFTESSRAEPTGSTFGDLSSPEPRKTLESTHLLADGRSIRVESIVSRLHDAEGRTIGSLAVVRDVTQRHREQSRRDALADLNDHLRDVDDVDEIAFQAARTLGELLDVSRVGFGTVDHDAETLHVLRDWCMPGVASLAGAHALRAFGSFIDNLKRNELVAIADVREDDRTSGAAAALEQRTARSLVNVPVVERGRLVAMLYLNHAQVRRWSADDLHFVRDVADRLRASSERSRAAAALRESETRLRQTNENLEEIVAKRTRELMVAEEALRQSQKMEAVGQLTGGIAHDFNNLLAGISASLQVLKTRLAQGRTEGLDRYILMGQEAVKRAASLTQRLLAFARRQTLDPKPTDVHRLVTGLEELIRRTVGPSVKLQVVCAPGLWATKIDASQLENALLNLCINARDAMLPDGGTLRIEVANKVVDAARAQALALAPGDYLTIDVEDTGTGMPPEIVKRVFDPFFTTKPMGQGTGLGLSMVYGFVRQSGGQVDVSSEPGRGTCMCLYLPRHDGVSPAEEGVDAAFQPASGTGTGTGETVLLIEDEATIRSLISEVLRDAGYEVRTAIDGQSGLKLLRSEARIDLLVTDVGLPGGLNGRQIADAARLQRPALKVLFITGYAENAAVGNGLLEPGMQVLTKPFDLTTLVRRVGEMIESG